MSDQIITRTPDKMVDFDHGYMMLAFRNDLVYVDCNVYGINDLTKVPARCMKEDQVAEIELTREEIQLICLSKNYKIITIQEIGS